MYKLFPVDPSTEVNHYTNEDLTNRTFLIDEDDGCILRGKVQYVLEDKQGNKQVVTSIGEDDRRYQEVMNYNDLCDMLRRQDEAESEGTMEFFPYKEICGHKNVTGTDEYKGSSWNVLVRWEDDSKTWEPLNIMIKDDPYAMAKYALDNKLLDEPGWKRCR